MSTLIALGSCESGDVLLVSEAPESAPAGDAPETPEGGETLRSSGGEDAGGRKGVEGPSRRASVQGQDNRRSSGAAGVDGGGPGGKELRSVVVRFEAKLGNQVFACGRVNSGVGSTRAVVEPIDLRFFVQQLALVDGAGRAVSVRFDERLPWQAAEVALLDFEDASGGCVSGNPGTNEIITGSVPAGDYRGLELVVGVPESLNHADPASAPAPLQAGGMSWGWLLGHKFFVAELLQRAPALIDAGVADAGAKPAAPAALGHGLLHLGSTGCSGNPGAGAVECARPNRVHVHFDEFDADADTVVVDVAEIFGATDLKVPAQCHSTGRACAPLFERLGVTYPEGQPTAGQRAFSVGKSLK